MEQPRPEEIANAVSVTAEALLKLHTAGLVEQSNIDKANMLLGKLLDNVISGMQEGGNEDHDMGHHPDMTSPDHNLAPSMKK
tara:strand:+ start:97 stop:342 length:246 start_codon:yes stop_codon:yes gene_type:complete